MAKLIRSEFGYQLVLLQELQGKEEIIKIIKGTAIFFVKRLMN